MVTLIIMKLFDFFVKAQSNCVYSVSIPYAHPVGSSGQYMQMDENVFRIGDPFYDSLKEAICFWQTLLKSTMRILWSATDDPDD